MRRVMREREKKRVKAAEKNGKKGRLHWAPHTAASDDARKRQKRNNGTTEEEEAVAAKRR